MGKNIKAKKPIRNGSIKRYPATAFFPISVNAILLFFLTVYIPSPPYRRTS
jgi:hypothetical protein